MLHAEKKHIYMCTRYSTREEDQNVPEYTGAHVPSPNMDVLDREKRSDSQRF